MKKTIICIGLILGMSLSGYSQIQNGLVKTKGRITADGKITHGKPLSNVSVIVKNGNAVLSRQDGHFSFTVKKKSYSLKDVYKNGYQLVDPDVLARQYSVSLDTLILTLETPEERWEDNHIAKQAIRNQLEKKSTS